MWKNNRRDSQLSCSGENYYHHSRNIPHPRMVRHIPGLNNTLVCAVSSSLPKGHSEGRADVPKRLGKNSAVPEKLLQKRFQASAQPAHRLGLQDTPLPQRSSPSVSSRYSARVQGSSDLCDVDREIKVKHECYTRWLLCSVSTPTNSWQMLFIRQQNTHPKELLLLKVKKTPSYFYSTLLKKTGIGCGERKACQGKMPEVLAESDAVIILILSPSTEVNRLI
ncbi:uncharacterized protein LOC130158763 [Falco biarmicus]|uniref:uncharacterized protein LOC130158763 n=1 Tax=Falco biarmicus TaxID=345155 RepID=UPI0024BC98E2|nr:uncharacterized protein LOC130158763 [Falco biarmicus]